MKKNENSCLGLFLLCLLLLIGCQKEEVAKSSKESLLALPEFITEGNELSLYGFLLPEQTKIVKEKVDGRSTARFVFPTGVKLVGLNKDNSLSFSLQESYTCTGDCKKGCDVVRLGNDVGCSACEDTNKPPCTGQYTSPSESLKVGFVDMNVGVSLLKKSDKKKFISTPSWEILSQIPEVTKAIEDFNTKYYGTPKPDDSFENVEKKGYIINLFGSPAVYYIPTSYFKNNPQARTEDYYEELESESGGGSVTCTCESGTRCTKEAIKSMGMTIGHKCVSGSNCTKCKMSW